MFFIKLTREGAVEAVYEGTTEKEVKEMQQEILEANQKAEFLKFITEKDAAEYLNAILSYAKKQELRADNAEMRLDEYYEYDE